MKRRLTSQEIYLRNAGFAVADDALSPDLRKKMAADLRAEIQRQRVAAERATRFRPDNRRDAVSDKTLHIREIVVANRELAHKPAQLRKLCDEKILNGMRRGRFGNAVSEARKFLGIP